jgi:uncharacterized protein YgbK (DUF1537 family)
MQLPGLSVGIVADDLTGACDTALQFFSTHAKAHVLLDLRASVGLPYPSRPDSQENQVWSINTSSRHTNQHEAQALVHQAIALCRDRYGVENFYKKLDSTLRGHIAQECLAMLDELKAQCAVIVPAYPEEGRRTVGGYQLLRGVPVEKTIVARDPLFPVRQSHVPTLLEQASRPELVGHITLSTVLHGAGPILVKLNELIKEGRKLVVVDATTNEDLEQIALAIEKAQKYAKVLPCGSAGLAQALANLWAVEPEQGQPQQQARPALSAPPSPILVVSGSNTDITRQQILRLVENYAYYGQGSQLELVDLSPEEVLGLRPVDDIVQRIVAAMGERNTVVLSSCLKDESYTRTLNVAREHEISDVQASESAQKVLAAITEQVLKIRSAKLILAGGETTCHVCAALGSQELEIMAEADISIPLTRDTQGRWIVTKSGGFGTPMALANVIKFIKQRESTSVHA